MKNENILDAIGMINDDVIREAKAYKCSNKISLHKRLVASVAAIVICFTLAVPALAATVPAFYEMLYEISPATAQAFKPVQRSCEDNGIRMEVLAAYIHEDTAEIYISMQDLEKTRVDETIDFFDSYQINTPFDCTGHCQLSSYDPDTQTATFLITIEQWNEQNIIGDKLTFSIREFLSNKKTYEGIIDDVSLDNIELNTATQTVHPRGLGGIDLFDEYTSSSPREGVTVLKPVGGISSPINGVTLTGIGYIDGCLHVQVYYEDILKTDNHGSIALTNSETSEMITCNGSISFFDDAREGSYEDYIFTKIVADALGDYELYGDFVTSSGSVEGNWSVTFPLEDTNDE